MDFFDDIAQRVRDSRFGETVQDILDFAKEVGRCNQAFEREDRRTWLEEQDIHVDTWARILGVANTPWLHDPAIQKKLPANLTTLSLLAKLSTDELNDAERAELINPGLTYRKLAHWTSERRKEKSQKTRLLKVLDEVIALPHDVSEEQMEEVKQVLRTALAKLTIEARMIRMPEVEKLEEKAEQQWQKAKFDQIFEDLAPAGLTRERLDEPLKAIIGQIEGLDNEKYMDVALIKCTHEMINGKTKQGRYKNKERVLSLAYSQNQTALRIAEELMGRDYRRLEGHDYMNEYDNE